MMASGGVFRSSATALLAHDDTNDINISQQHWQDDANHDATPFNLSDQVDHATNFSYHHPKRSETMW